MFRVKAKAEGRTVRCPKCKVPVLITRETKAASDEAQGELGETSAENRSEDDAVSPIAGAAFDSPPSLPPNLPEATSFPEPPADGIPLYEPSSELKATTPPQSVQFALNSHASTNVLLALLLIVASATAFLQTVQLLGLASTPTTFAPTKWDYQIVAPSDATLDLKLKSLGNKGWEVASARRATSSFGGASYELILRRPKSAAADD